MKISMYTKEVLYYHCMALIAASGAEGDIVLEPKYCMASPWFLFRGPYDDSRLSENLTSFSLKDGATLWHYSQPINKEPPTTHRLPNRPTHPFVGHLFFYITLEAERYATSVHKNKMIMTFVPVTFVKIILYTNIFATLGFILDFQLS